MDPNTRLPSLPVVVDAVRRRLEGGERLGLIYVDPSAGGGLEESCGWQAYDLLMRDLAKALRQIRRQHLERRTTLALAEARGDEFLLFVGLDETDPEPLATVHEIVRQRLEGDLMVRCDGEPRPLDLLVSVAVELEAMPRVRIERVIFGALRRARELGRQLALRQQSGRLRALERLLANDDVVIRFQPISGLGSGLVHGFEALGAATTSDFFDNAETLFTFAESSERIGELERLCRRQAVRRAVPLIEHFPGCKLFLNCSPHAFGDPELIADLVEGAVLAGCRPGDLVLEVTERVAITEWQQFRRVLADLRYAGLAVAIDDMGSGYSSLQAVAEIQPDYLKIDSSLVQELHRSPIKRDLVHALSTLSAKLGASSIGEGIEHPGELEALRALGVDYGQGYLLAQPNWPEELARAGAKGFPIVPSGR